MRYEAHGIAKHYGGVTALDGVDFTLTGGTVHALLGENGAGKSTLVKILAGVLRPDTGRLFLDGRPVRFHHAREAAAAGVAVVSQELSLFGDLDILANLYPGWPLRRAGLLVHRREMAARARPVLADLGLDAPLRTPVAELGLAEQQLVEIARALLAEPAVLILDEPTSAQHAASTDRLLAILDVLRSRDIAVGYVTHTLDEVMAACDLVSVLRDGRLVLDAEPRERLTVDGIVTAMLGRPQAANPPTSVPPPSNRTSRSVRLDALSLPGGLAGVDFEARGGEIVGLAGLGGAGQDDVLAVLAGRRAPSGGRVRLPDGGGRPRTPRHAIERGVAIVPADRRRALMPERPIWENTAQVTAVALGRGGRLLSRRRLAARARGHLDRLGIGASSPEQPAGSLSGGNQQKLVFAKWLDADPELLLLDDPSRGVDVGARAEMHRIIRGLAAEGRIVLLTSTDLAELAELCDRVVVFHRKRVTAELAGPALTEHGLLHAVNAGSRA